MKKKVLFWAISLLAGLVLLGMTTHNMSADHPQSWRPRLLFVEQTSTPTLIPTVTPSFPETETPTPRVLPPVGNNAGLVFGAIVLVLIVIGGVVFSSRKKK